MPQININLNKQNVWITGDMHGEVNRFSRDNLKKALNYDIYPLLKNMNKEDNIFIVCGDFGVVFNDESEKEEKHDLDWLNECPFTIAFIDGNHEGYDRLNKYSITEWNGGRVQKLRDNVIHLMRGEIYSIFGKKIFTFGGASSHDIQDGVIPRCDNWKEIYNKWWKSGKKNFRVEGVSWWKEELPCESEMKYGWTNLKKSDFKVDYIITHQPPENVMERTTASDLDFNDFTNFLEQVDNATEYEKWFMGHIHMDYDFDLKHKALYYDIVKIL